MHTFEVEGVGQELRLVRFEGVEAISQLFRFDVIVVASERDIAFQDFIGKPALLTIHVSDIPRYLHGMVSRVEQGDEGTKQTAYRITVVPEVFRLGLRKNSRIFQELTVPDIVKKVLEDAGIDSSTFRLAIRGNHPTREYCVQYRESDWAFISRLLEEEGICYFFQHEEAKHILVMADKGAEHPPIAGKADVTFRPPSGAIIHDEHISRFQWAEQVRSGKVTLRDYDFKRPALSLEASAQADLDTDLEDYDAPGEYEEPDVGSDLSTLRLEELQMSRKTGQGEGICARLVPGHSFQLANHARGDFNREYIVTKVEHRGFEPGMEEGGGTGTTTPYGNRFEVIPSDVPYRPARVTPRPTVKGIHTAIVVGPSGEEIHTDEHGRIKVQFHWDRLGKNDDKSSCWMRVAQPWAGAAFGAVFLPRVGHEVVIDFIEGDPDRPLVMGSVYHGTNVPPYPLPAQKTKSTIKSQTSPGGEGFNELRFEDKKGQEEIFLHAQKDLLVIVLNDEDRDVGHDREEHIGHDHGERVDNDRSASVGRNEHLDVGGDRDEAIAGNDALSVGKDRTVEVSGAHTEDVGKSQTISIGTSMSVSVGENKSESVGKSSSETVEKNKTSSVGENYSLKVTKDMSVVVDKNAKEEVKEKKTIIVGKKLGIQVGDATITIEKNGNITVQGKKIVVKGEGPIQVEGKKLTVKSEGAVNVEASGKVKVKGSQVGVN